MYLELLKAGLSFIMQLLRFKSSRKYMDEQFQRTVQVYESMQILSSLPDIHRVSILKIENSGGLIDPKVQLYASVLHEDYTQPLSPSKAKYGRIPVDQTYIRTLHKVIREQNAILIVDQQEDGLMKTIHKTEGVIASEMYYMGSTPKVLYIMSVSTATTPEAFERDEYKLSATIACEHIKKLLWNGKQ